MFANPIWSLLLLCVPVAIYWFVIKPKLQAKLSEIYAEDGWWNWIKSLLYAFRTPVVGALGIILTALPDLLVIVAPVDFSPWLPQPWPAYTGPITSAVIVLMKAFETKPGEDK